jgi:hypothetical protein
VKSFSERKSLLRAMDSALANFSPSSDALIQRFLDREDLSELENPLVFDKTKSFNSYLCCVGALNALASLGVTAIFCPVAVWCPGRMYKHFGLKVSFRDSRRLTV